MLSKFELTVAQRNTVTKILDLTLNMYTHTHTWHVKNWIILKKYTAFFVLECFLFKIVVAVLKYTEDFYFIVI